MRYFLPAISTTTSGIAQDLVDGIHGGDQATGDVRRRFVEPLGLGARLVEVAGELCPLSQQLLGVGFDAGVSTHAAVEAAHARLQALECPIQPLGRGLDAVFDVSHWSARKSRDSRRRHYSVLSLTGKPNLLSQCPPRRRPVFRYFSDPSSQGQERISCPIPRPQTRWPMPVAPSRWTPWRRPIPATRVCRWGAPTS